MHEYVSTQTKIQPDFKNTEFIEMLEKQLLPQAEYNVLTTEVILPVKKYIKEKFDEKWNTGYIFLIHKSGSNKLPINFRPICVPNMVVKRFESNLYKYYCAALQLDRTQFLGKLESAVINVLQFITMIKSSGGKLLFVDIENAYGSVDLTLMAQMINNEELRDYFTRFYKDPEVKFKTGERITWRWGLFQGSPMSNLYFQIYMDYVLRELKLLPIEIIAFVDDLVIYMPPDCTATINDIETILKRFNFHLNLKKTKIFTGSKLQVNYLGYDVFNIKENTKKYLKNLSCLDNIHDFVEFIRITRKHCKLLHLANSKYLTKMIIVSEQKFIQITKKKIYQYNNRYLNYIMGKTTILFMIYLYNFF